MRSGPDAASLLRLVKRVLKENLSCHVPEARRYEFLLIGAALDIAAREAAAGDAPLRAACATLRKLVDENGGDGSETLEDSIKRLSTRLAADIRSGAHDGDPRTHAALLELTEQLLAESNPKALLSNEQAENL